MCKIPVIIDTDPGIDDFFAIMLANSCTNFDIRGLSSVAGNMDIDTVSENLKRIADLLNIDTKIVRGAKKPILGEQITAGHIHGENGLANMVLAESDRKFEDTASWDFIYKEAKAQDKKLRLIALGPLTNIAVSILKYPDLKDFIRDIIIMGGSTTTGNVTPYGEFNITADPVAADIVFKSGIDITMVGLNVTEETGLSKQELEELKNIKHKYQKEVNTLLEFLENSEILHGFKGVILHDALTLAYAANNEVLEVKDLPVYIETYARLNKGRTVVDLDNWRKDKIANAKVAIGVNKSLYYEMLKEMLKTYAN